MRDLSSSFAAAIAVLTLLATPPPVMAAAFDVTTTDPSTDFLCDSHCSFSDALYQAQLTLGPDEVNLPAGLFAGTSAAYAFNCGWELDHAVTVTGAGIDTTIIDGGNLPGCSAVEIGIGDETLTFRNLTISGGAHAGIGGYLDGAGRLLIDQVKLTSNGAGIELDLASPDDLDNEVEITNSIISGNGGSSAYTSAMYLTGTNGTDDVLVSNSTIENNSDLESFFQDAIYLDTGRFVFDNVTVNDNVNGYDAAIVVYGATLLVQDSSVSDNAGGDFASAIAVNSASSLTLRRALIDNNAALDAYGAITADSESSIVVDQSTISRNVSTSGSDMPAGVYSEGELTVTNSTVSGNEGCGLFSDGIVAVLNNSTIANNGAFNGSNGAPGLCGDFVVSNSIVANNYAPHAVNCESPPTSLGYNLEDGNTCELSGPGDLASIADVGLAPLGNYGGATPTLAPCTAVGAPHGSCTGPSVALDAANPAAPGGGSGACEVIDQRGSGRPAGPRCDIGAVESECAGADSDGDGVCDQQDMCTNIDGQQQITVKPKVQLIKVNDGVPGNDGLKLSGEFPLPITTSFAGIDPAADGARIVVANAIGDVLLDIAIPSGAYAGAGTRGWTQNGSATKWTYKDSTASPVNGLFKLIIQDRSSKAPNQVRVLAKGKNGNYPIAPADLPLRVAVILGSQTASENGECGEITFAAGDCTENGAQTKLSCKQ